MSDSLIDIEGIGPADAAKLAEQGLRTTDDLLARGARPVGRAALAQATGFSTERILTWVNHADLFRIRGVAGQFAELLEAGGVDTVVELAQRNPDNLAKKLAETNAARNLTNRVPSATEIADWVAQAKGMPRAVFYDDAPSSGTPAPAPAVATSAPAPAAPEAAAEPAPAATAQPATAPRAIAAPAVTTDERSWLMRILDRIRGR